MNEIKTFGGAAKKTPVMRALLARETEDAKGTGALEIEENRYGDAQCCHCYPVRGRSTPFKANFALYLLCNKSTPLGSLELQYCSSVKSVIL